MIGFTYEGDRRPVGVAEGAGLGAVGGEGHHADGLVGGVVGQVAAEVGEAHVEGGMRWLCSERGAKISMP